MGTLGIRKLGESKIRLIAEQEYSRDHKEQNLHSLITDNPGLVLRENSEGQRFPAMTVGSHLRLGDVEADLLIVDISGSALLVELKRGRAPRDIVAQILDYASRLRQLGLDGIERLFRGDPRFPEGIVSVLNNLLEANPDFKEGDFDNLESFKENLANSLIGKELQLVIVSYSVDENVLTVIRHLREVYGVDIYSVEFDYYIAEGFEYFVPEITGVETRKPPRPGTKETQLKYQEYWGSLLDMFKRAMPGVTSQKPPPQNWISLPIGHNGIHFEWAFHGRPRSEFEVGFHLERPDVDENRRIFQLLKAESKQLEKETGETLSFQEQWGIRWSRVYATCYEGEMTEELKKWAVDTMVKFYKAFKPRVDGILRTH